MWSVLGLGSHIISMQMAVSSACHVDQMILQALNEVIWSLNITVINLGWTSEEDEASFQYLKKYFMNTQNITSIAKEDKQMLTLHINAVLC